MSFFSGLATRTEDPIPENANDQMLEFLHPRRGSIIDRKTLDRERHIYDDQVEFPDIELDVARAKVWTHELNKANKLWYDCKKKYGHTDESVCFEEAENLRKEHWRHQLLLKETGCEEKMYRYAKCLQRTEKHFEFCRDLEYSFQRCVAASNKLNLVPDTPVELKRPASYPKFWYNDWKLFKQWNATKEEYLYDHPEWFNEHDIQTMNAKQLFNFIKKEQDWTERGQVKVHSTYAYPTRYREYIPRHERNKHK